MSDTIFERISNYLSKKTAVQRLSEDPALVSELLLLVRLVFADGQKHQAEMNALLHIMQHDFGIKPEELPEVADYLKTFAYETSNAQAAALFSEMAPERRQSLINHLVAIAQADHEIHPAESALIARVIAQLNVDPEELFIRRQGGGQPQ
ncbi:TerB family tellurite resistance protein [Pseudochrobactrum sp. HB0163]|uniref:tellurite resistance TerB family protein n=1 Tax=Pseudochrobactrum sp. HB0163 TaxID=3450708 RepID=UPI003F6E120C